MDSNLTSAQDKTIPGKGVRRGCFGWLAFFVVILASSLFISIELLNLLGVLLNFLAAFMLAPDLLGAERLNTIEEAIEAQLASLMKYSTLFSRGVTAFIKNRLFILTFVFVILSATVILTAIVIDSDTMMLLLFPLLILYPTLFQILFIQKRTIWTIVKALFFSSIGFSVVIAVAALLLPSAEAGGEFLGYFFMYFISTFFLLAIGMFFLLILFFSANAILKQLVSRLEGDEKLRSYLLYWGIWVFVLGNVLQLIGGIRGWM